MKKSIKKVVSLLIAIVMLAVSVPFALVQVQAYGSISYALNPDGASYCVLNCDDNYFGRAKILATYEGLPVTKIAAKAFDNSDIYAVVIPDSVNVIGDNAFSGCEKLKTVAFGSGITEIGAYAFNACTRLSSITIPESVAVIGDYAFTGCTSLREIYVLSAATDISMYSDLGDTSGAVIYGYLDSTAENYALSNNIKFKSIICEMTKISSPVSTSEGVSLSWSKVEGASYYRVYRKTQSEKSWSLIGDKVKRTNFIDANVISGEKYIYTVRACNDYVYGEYDSYGVDTMYLATPVLSSVASSEKGVTLKWSAVDGAEEYYVYHKAAGGKWEKIGSTTKLSFVDRTAENGVEYKYTVSAAAKAYRKTVESSYDKEGLTVLVSFVATPAIEKIDMTDFNQITLKWSGNEGAECYLVYRATSAEGKFSGVAKVKTNTWTDNDIKFNKKYYYKVVTVDEVQSAPSAVKSRTARLPAPVISKNLFVKPNSITVTWGKVDSASGYAVYRYNASSKKWVEIAKLRGNTNVSYTDKITGTYEYKVYSFVTINNKDYFGVASEAVKLTTFAKPSLSVGQYKNAFTDVVKWKPVKNATGYLLYYRVGKTGAWTKAATLSNRITSYTMDVNHGQYYYWRVRPIYDYNGHIIAGSYSNTADVMIFYTPNVRVAVSTETVKDAKNVVVSIENKGVCDLTVIRDGAFIYNGADKPKYNGNISLVDVNTKKIKEQVIAPGTTANVIFSIDGPEKGHYDINTIVQLYFTYDNVKYVMQTDAKLAGSNARYQRV